MNGPYLQGMLGKRGTGISGLALYQGSRGGGLPKTEMGFGFYAAKNKWQISTFLKKELKNNLCLSILKIHQACLKYPGG